MERMDRLFTFEKLVVWGEMRAMIGLVYKITEKFPATEKYGLINQIRRASISVAANLAEGSSRKGPKDQAHFYQIAYASLMEFISLVLVSYDLGYLDSEHCQFFRKKTNTIGYMIKKLREKVLL